VVFGDLFGTLCLVKLDHFPEGVKKKYISKRTTYGKDAGRTLEPFPLRFVWKMVEEGCKRIYVYAVVINPM